MKKIYIFLLFSISIFIASAQVGEWVWINGSNTLYSNGSTGVQGVPSPSNTPPALYEACEWTDLNGNFWLFGGASINANIHDDLWKYDPITNEWTWITGTNTMDSPGNYGTQGVASPSNSPPSKGYGITSWTDLNGNLWMFGGGESTGTYNDLWKYDINTNEWTWMKGPNSTTQPGVYGTLGVPDTANNPGSREECAAGWTDEAGDLWLFGGLGIGGTYNDLWRYNIATNTWTWMKGPQTAEQPAVYGIMGVEDSLNTPGARESHCRWTDSNGNLWLFGSQGYTLYTNYNDLWKFNPTTNNWTWINGDSAATSIGSYGTKCLTSVNNQPSARFENRAAWKDNNGNLWMLGGGIDVREDSVTNDLWMYCISTNQWIWIANDSIPNPNARWGTLGVSSSSNKPGGRGGALGWTDHSGHLYLFGGTAGITSTINPYNDLWKYTIDTTCGYCPALPASVASFQSNNTVTIYPNPATNQLTIHTSSFHNEALTISIMNVLGQEASPPTPLQGRGEDALIDVSKLSSGIYFLQLRSENGSVVRKFVKE